MTRFVRRIASVVAAAALLFGQLAMAVHACDRLAAPVVAAPDVAHDCCEKPKAPASDCERQCDYAASSVDTHAGSMTVAASSVPPALHVESTGFRNVPKRVIERPLEQRAEPPPLLARFTVLRI